MEKAFRDSLGIGDTDLKVEIDLKTSDKYETLI